MKTKELRVILADDDMDDCIFFKQALTELLPLAQLTIVNDGAQLMLLLNHKAGEEKKSADMPDVIFLDINMPRKNGMECLAELKENKLLKDIPVVMFSTLNSRDKISMLFKTGAEVYIHKPGDFAQLTRVIYHALGIATEKKLPPSSVKYILNA